MPVDGNPRACRAIWENGEITLKRINYDVERAVRRLYDVGLPKEIAGKMASALRKARR